MSRDWLSAILKEKKLTHKSASERCGISRAYLTQIIRGARRPSPIIAKQIAIGLGFPDTWYRLLD